MHVSRDVRPVDASLHYERTQRAGRANDRPVQGVVLIPRGRWRETAASSIVPAAHITLHRQLVAKPLGGVGKAWSRAQATVRSNHGTSLIDLISLNDAQSSC